MSTQLLTNPTAKPPEPPPPDPPRITEEEAALQKADARIKALEDEVATLKAKVKAKPKVRSNESVNETPNAKEPAKQTAWQTFEASAYTADCPEGCSGVTATGIDVTGTIYHAGKRIIAVDPSVIALGSTVEIKQADGTTFEAVAQDTGSAIKGAKIDVLVAREADAVQFGRQSVQVRVIN
ncbi:3D domain-containing protein [Bacillus subtilis]|uniref:3D domain-containing protein n=1 Tax=Bacillus subtilis TaxID=1423 RepID=UPI0023EBAB6D|nr:3D domain-containing protein [Bacillus subtilis]MDF4197326.1 3D domain-containing protein [Bacillus subtilis]MDF4219303.1 3D domain-containing protein [Bacillus subtilis]